MCSGNAAETIDCFVQDCPGTEKSNSVLCLLKALWGKQLYLTHIHVISRILVLRMESFQLQYK
jgi:hypothetical protein